jgi:hypothetical protein
MIDYLFDDINQICKESYVKKINLPLVEEQLEKVFLIENGSDLDLGEC